MAAICCSNLPSKGRLGNQIWRYASMLGIADKMGVKLNLPSWKYSKYFKGKFPEGPQRGRIIHEPAFHYCPDFILNDGKDYDIDGYLQSERYCEHIKDYVKKQLEWEPNFLEQVKAKYADVLNSKPIAISVRQGDYRSNPNYEVLPAMYYILSLYEHFPDWKSREMLFFSDDINWCKLHFGCLPNAHFAPDFTNKEYFFDETSIEQLCLGSLCNDFILANSTFSWWMAWLGEKEGSKVVRPAHYMAGKLKEKCDMKDFWPERWVEFDHKGKKFDLSDCTVVIPISFDHPDRRENIGLSVCMVQKDFDCQVFVGEQGGDKFSFFSQWCRYFKFGMKAFHRTKILNDLIKASDTEIVFNYDCDVLIPPMAIIQTVEALRSKKFDFCFPYKEKMARVPRNPWFKMLEKYLDVGILAGQEFNGMRKDDALSVGGCVACNKRKFIEAGMENEGYRSWSNEDTERVHRWNLLGYKVGRVGGVIFHLDHHVGINSSNNHPYHEHNKQVWREVKSKETKKELRKLVDTWEWAK